MPPVATSRDVPVDPAVDAEHPAAHPAAAPDARVPATSPGHVLALVRAAIPPLHPGGRPLVAGVAAAAGLTRLVTGRGAVVGALATAAVAAFFRNPRRVPPTRSGVALAPADGTVALVSEVVPPPELDLPRVPAPRVSVFLSVLDVHVQRIPADGRVLDVQYRPGTFLSADLDKASEDNERNALLLETTEGARIGVVQIAGLLARRIRCDVAPGDEVAAGETYGLIRFGSRVDTYLPAGSTVPVAVGQRTIGGETVLGELPGPARHPLSAVPNSRAGVRLLPNAVTVLALCSGLTAVRFALDGRFELCVAAVAAAAIFDALDGGLARLLDASSKIGAELDSLSDLIAFGVSPALLIYIWRLDGTRLGWVVALVFAVCMALRLARFNTLIDAEQRWPFAKKFFVGVPAPAAALVGGLPLLLWLQFGDGWWAAPLTVGLWALLAGGLMVSRLPTISLKTARMPTGLIAPALVLVGLGFAVLVTAPFLLMSAIGVGYLLLLPFTIYRYEWLKRHPEAWNVPAPERRAIARAARSARRLGLRSPLRRRVAGGARTVARAVFRPDEPPRAATNGAPTNGAGRPRGHGRDRLGLRRR